MFYQMALPWPALLTVALAYLRLVPGVNLRRGQSAGKTGWAELPPEWFEAQASHGDMDAVADRWDPEVYYPKGQNSRRRDGNFFDESISNGPNGAWQTHSPATGKDFQNTRSVVVSGDDRWRYTPDGWEPQFKSSSIVKEINRADRHNAAWFDAKAQDYDVYGRRVAPAPGTVKRLMAENGGGQWYERSVNTTVRCADPNCTGKAYLQAFFPDKEEASHCFMSIHVHPTDFDGDRSAENLAFWVNGFLVRAECEPMARGCNTSAWRPLYSCLRDMRVDHLINPKSGQMAIEGKISLMVDECPYQGNLLSAVAQATCMVRPKAKAYALVSSGALNVPKPLNVSTQLRCRTPGCNASTVLYIDSAIASHGGTCLLNWTIMETDFDRRNEFVEYLTIDGVNGGKNLLTWSRRPRKNPCNMQYSNKTVFPSDRIVRAIQNLNVTDEIRMTGKLIFRGKISKMVDECAYQDHLLNSVISVACTPPPSALAALSTLAATVSTSAAPATITTTNTTTNTTTATTNTTTSTTTPPTNTTTTVSATTTTGSATTTTTGSATTTTGSATTTTVSATTTTVSATTTTASPTT